MCRFAFNIIQALTCSKMLPADGDQNVMNDADQERIIFSALTRYFFKTCGFYSASKENSFHTRFQHTDRHVFIWSLIR